MTGCPLLKEARKGEAIRFFQRLEKYLMQINVQPFWNENLLSFHSMVDHFFVVLIFMQFCSQFC